MSDPAGESSLPRLVVEAAPIPALLLVPGKPAVANRAARTLFRLGGGGIPQDSLPAWLLDEVRTLEQSAEAERCFDHLPTAGTGSPLAATLRRLPPTPDTTQGGVIVFLQERPPLVPASEEGSEENAVPLIRLLRTLLGNMKHRVFFKDVDSVYVAVSQSFATDFGRRPEEFIGKTDLDFFPEEWAEKFRGDDQRVMRHREGETILEEIQIRGEWRYLEVAKAPVLTDNDSVVGIIGMYQDVTERHQAEDHLARERELLQALMENVPELIFFKDSGSRFTRVNRALSVHLGLEDPSQAEGKTDFNFYPPELAQEFLKDEQELLRSGRPVLNKLERQSRGAPVPEVRWVRTTKAALRGADGKPRGIVGIARDVTEHVQTEEMLRRIAEELSQSNQELQQFAYVASHDLQEPLRVIRNYLQRLARRTKGQLDEESSTLLAGATEGAGRMQHMVEDLLAYCRVESRTRPLREMDLETALDRALLNLEVALGEAHAEVRRHPLPTVQADQLQIVQLFQNLVGNALKFRGDKPARVCIDAERFGEEWTIRVRDEGIGIAEEHRERIFSLFQRLHTTEEYPGSGIGLAICRKIVTRHGGRIWVESIPGAGATFIFTLPVTGAPASPDP